MPTEELPIVLSTIVLVAGIATEWAIFQARSAMNPDLWRLGLIQVGLLTLSSAWWVVEDLLSL
nr:hypothetical protein [uncultured Rhodoferax sp.]